MEIFLLVIIVILFIFLAKNNNDLAKSLRNIESELQLLKKELVNRKTDPLPPKEEIAPLPKKPVQQPTPTTGQWESGFKVLKEEGTLPVPSSVKENVEKVAP